MVFTHKINYRVVKRERQINNRNKNKDILREQKKMAE